MSQTSIKITAVIPAYNNGTYLRRSINSALNQTRAADEIIVIDDGSTDNTSDIAHEFSDQIRYIHQENAGASAARNTGIQAATGNWIAFLDADDEWLPHHLQTQTDLLAKNPHLVWTTGNYKKCLCWENRQADNLPLEKIQKVLCDREYIEDYLISYPQGFTGHTDTMVIQRQALLEAGLFTVGQKRANDLDLWWRIAYRWPQIGFVAEPLAIHHMDVHGSISRTYSQIELYRNLIDRHLKLAKEHHRLDALKPCASKILRSWMRNKLFEGQGKEIRELLTHYNSLFTTNFKSVMWLLTCFPRLTALACRLISKIIRTLHLRKQPVRRPQ